MKKRKTHTFLKNIIYLCCKINFLLNNTYKNKKHIHKSIVYVILFFLFTGVHAQNKSIGISMQEDIKIQTTVFYSKEAIYISKESVLSIQIDKIIFEDDVVGVGLLHITSKKKVTVKTIKPIRVAHVEIENTTIDMQSDIVITGELQLKNATILLNDFNLQTEKKVIFDEKSEVIENGEGVWIKKSHFIKEIVIHQKTTPKTTQKHIEIKIVLTTKTNTIQCALTKNSLFTRELICNNPYIAISKPPPKVSST